MFRKACGRITSRMAWPRRMPSASAAESWPCEMLWIPARMISAK